MSQVPTVYEDWVEQFVRSTAAHFNFHGWSILIKHATEDTNDSTYADNRIDSVYMTSTITFSARARQDFKERNIQWLVISIIHELTHLFFDPFHEFVDPYLSKMSTPFFMDMLENQTQRLTMVIMKNLPENLLNLMRGVLIDEDEKEAGTKGKESNEDLLIEAEDKG